MFTFSLVIVRYYYNGLFSYHPNVLLNQLIMALRKTPNSTEQTAYELMFGRKVRTRLDLMKASQIE